MRDRYLFSADHKASEYRTLLEITPGRARLLTPSRDTRQARWLVSIVLAVALFTIWTFSLGPVLALLGPPSVPSVVVWVFLGAATVLWLAVAFVLFQWWDRQSLPILADAPSQTLNLLLLGARSFGTFQDVRARTPSGEEIHLVVDARAPRFWEAVRLLEGNASTSG